MTIPSPAPGGGVYTGLDPFGRPSLVTNYAPGPTGGYGRINVWQFYQEMDQGNHALMFNRALAAVSALGGGVIYVPTGIYTIATTIVMLSNIILIGDGIAATILQAAVNLNNDVIQGQNFATLTGTNNPSAGIFNWGLRGLTIDGNKANNSSGYGLRVYGAGFTIEDVHIRNCAQDGLYSEFATAANEVPVGESLEAYLTHVKAHDNLRHGITWAGPHDSLWDDVDTFQNGTAGDNHAGMNVLNNTTMQGGRLQILNSHSWGNSQAWALRTEAAVSLSNNQWEGAQSAQVLLTGSDSTHVAADSIMTGDVIYAAGSIAAPVGIEIGAIAIAPTGLFLFCKIINCTTAALKFTNDAGLNRIEAQVYQTSGSATSGTPAASTQLNVQALSTGTSQLSVVSHLVARGAAPTLGALQAGISTQSITGNDICGTITLTTTAAPPAANAQVAIINFAALFDTNAPIMVLQQAGSVVFYWSGATPALFNVLCGAALAATTTYFIHYLNVGRL